VADAQQTQTTFPANADNRSGETVGRVNVYDNSTATTPPLEHRTTYSEPATPVTRSSPSLVTWLIILVLVVLALYFVVQFLA
jgi:hypothetical protein